MGKILEKKKGRRKKAQAFVPGWPRTHVP